MKPGLHPRNPHRHGYDFAQLVQARPELAAFVARNAYGGTSIDFGNAAAVRALNAALLAVHYGITTWDLPDGALCPPVPGRADYVHHLADLLAGADGVVPRGDAVRVLDIGVGASCIYPILGRCAYGWRFVGTDVSREALLAAQRTVDENVALQGGVLLRHQTDAGAVFAGVVEPGEVFDAALCNPPFHASLSDAQEGSRRKWRNLGRAAARSSAPPALNFGGQGAELWTPGGETAFVRRMIAESARRPELCRWFTTIVSREALLPALQAALRSAGAVTVKTIDMAQGQKRSRILAWSFARS